MSANFLNNKAVVAGTDLHMAKLLSPKLSDLLTGAPFDYYPYGVAVIYSWPGGDDSKRTSTVTADGSKMIREGFEISKVPHVPMAGPLHPAGEAIQMAQVIKDSTSKPFLTVMSVKSEGDPLALCMKGAAGFNLDCNAESSMWPTGAVICVCSVQTQPTVKDFVFRVFDEFIKKWLADKIVELMDQVMKRLKPKVVPEIVWKIPRAIVRWVAKKVVPKLIDKAEEAAKKALDKADRARRGAPAPALAP